ncbi:MAG: hypothetical protein AAGN82_25240, partial [Myxococcota bacterium]
MRNVWPAFIGLLLVGCGEEEMMTPTPTSGATAGVASAKPRPTATTTTTASAEAGAVCRVIERKVWAKGANPRTGLTPRDLGETYGVGMAIGNRPHRLVFDGEGGGALEPLPLAAGHVLTRGVPLDDGVRHLQRVTLNRSGRAFADYRDKYEDGRRRIACGPLDVAGAPFLVFDGQPLLDTDDSGRGRDKTPVTEVPPAAATTTSPSGTASAVSSVSSSPPAATASSRPPPAATASASATAVPPPPPATPRPPSPPGVELRDCRTFSDTSGNDVFAIGSELYRGDGGWRMRFVLVTDEAGGNRIELGSYGLGDEPTRLHTLEAPVAHRLADGGWVVAGRYRGQLLVWLLDEQKKPRGDRATFAGGYPSLPRFFADGAGVHFLLTSLQVKPNIWKLQGLRFGNPPVLPEDMFDPEPPRTAAASAAEPTLARVGEQRWLTFHAGARRRGVVEVAPVDAQIRTIGASFEVTTPDVAAYESISFGRGDELVVVYISRPKQGATEVVSERLACRAKPVN